ncbi:MAG: rRNA methyltransferase [Chloroflexi bacterium]|nr:rRNA methyltransferase [Chloroflexota bacterium]
MPATFAAVGRALLEGARAMPGEAPRSLLDIGAGTGAATWAAGAIWPGLETVTLVDREPAMLLLGRRIAAAGAAEGPLASADWRLGTAGTAGADLPGADLVVAGYVLGELDDSSRSRLVETAWAATRGALVIVEPGSPAGFARILAAREGLIAAGAAIVAPCPGNVPCPVRGPAWCHFLARLDRSPLQRRAKGAERSWEDEPFSYVVASRAPGRPAPRVVLGRPRHRPGRVVLRVCTADGLAEPTISRRHGAAWQVARDLEWGDRVGSAVANRLAAFPGVDTPAET